GGLRGPGVAAGGDRAPAGRARRVVAVPVGGVRVGARLPGSRWLFRDPVRDHVVVGVVVGRDRDLLDPPRAPVLAGLDPQTRPALRAGFEVLVMVEIAVALHETKALRILGLEAADAERTGIVERPP